MTRPKYIASGSGVERLANCLGPLVLPHIHHETTYTERGTVIHRFLEDLVNSDRATALAAVPDAWRPVCAELDLTGLDMQLGAAAEVALAYHIPTDTARELGRGVGRRYDDVTEDEIPMTLDLVGMRLVKAGTRGLVVDWKSGWTTHRKVDKTEQPWQVKVGALAAARAFGMDLVEVQLVHVYEGRPPYVQRATLGAWELDAVADDLRELHARAMRARVEMAGGVLPSDLGMGPWCQHCPSLRACPAQMNLVAAIVDPDYVDDLVRMRPLPRTMLAEAWNRVKATRSLLNVIESAIRAAAAEESLYLGETGDGKHRWLGETISEGNERLDGETTYDVLEKMFGEELGEVVAGEATRLTATKKDLERAIRGHVPKGKGAENIRLALDAIRARGGGHRTVSVKVEEIVTKDATRPPPARLTAGHAAFDLPPREETDDDGHPVPTPE